MYDNLFLDEQPDYRSERISVHSNIDAILNDEYHCNYRNLHRQALGQSWYNKSLKTFYKMAGAKTNPPLSSQGQNAHDAIDIVNTRFVTAALQGRASTSTDANLITHLRTALTEAEFAREEIEETLSQFDPTLSISQYFSQHTNLHLIKSKGWFDRSVRRCYWFVVDVNF